MLIDGAQRSDSRLPFGRLVSTDQDSVGLFQVFDCCSLCEELRVGQNLKPQDEFKKDHPAITPAGIMPTCKLRLGFVLASNIRRMLSAALTGTVLFSVTIL